MMRCIIHIGMHKTGSTSIQSSLEGFEDDRFLYARLGNGGNHSLPIYSLFMDNPERHHLHRAGERDAEAVRAYVGQVWADLDRSIVAAQGRTLLISGEDIGVVPKTHLAKLRDYFCGRFEHVTIVGYVRPPAGYLASVFQQRVRGGSLRFFDPKGLYRSYRASFDKFDEIFGRERVELWKFDPKGFPDGCAVQDFCARLGIALPKKRIVRLNDSLSREAVSLLYTYATLGQEYGSHTMPGAEGMKLGLLIGGNNKFRLSPDVVRSVLEANCSDIEWMEARLGQSLQEELSDNRPGDVREERDLLRCDPQPVAKLLELLEGTAPEGVKGETPKEVARLVHALREKHFPRRTWQRGEVARQGLSAAQEGVAHIRVTDLINQIREKDANLLSGVSSEEVQNLIGNIFKYISERVSATEEGVVTFAGLGRFRVIRGGVDGRTDSVRTRIVFQPAGGGGGRT